MKFNKKTVSKCLALGLTVGLFATAGVVSHRENGYKSIAKELVERSYIAEENSMYLGNANDEYLLPNFKECTTISRGKYLKDEIEERGILYCELLDEYYTLNGAPIAIIDTYLDEGKTVYRRIEVLENLHEPLTILANEEVTIINTKPYSELESMDIVVKMDPKTKVLYQNQEMYEGNITLK